MAFLGALAFLIILVYFFICFLGTLNLAFELIPENALLPILLRTVVLMVMVLSLAQPLNAFAPILVMFLPNVIDFIFLQFLNAFLFISVIVTYTTVTKISINKNIKKYF